MVEPATKSSWKIKALPRQRARLDLALSLTASQFETMKQGVIPQEMEDRWFIFFEDGWLNLHRSWTGFCIFRIKIERVKGNFLTTEAWVNRNKKQFECEPSEEAGMVKTIIKDLFRIDCG